MENSGSFAGTLQHQIHSSSGSLDVHQPLLLRGYSFLPQTINSNDSANPIRPLRTSRIQWIEGTVINSGMGRRKINCCGVYPEIIEQSRSSTSSSSSDSSSDEEGDKPPKAYRCGKNCCGHPIVTFPSSNSSHPPRIPTPEFTQDQIYGGHIRFIIKSSENSDTESKKETNTQDNISKSSSKAQ
ncbi:hypothetical protein CRM22_008662 [Opisthorchis felineus]|uniref:Uncharacterized protein n=1 Tax=Opisthorchis felineus TaxID=147828 RepID=A0A4S2LID3_OPIFE|nr:hypothetical protein CRM22_008662 [Opisthorchis felineus]